jgi:uncharacterized protein (TIGR04255 family)
MTSSFPHPLGGPAPAEKRLPRAPLERVIAQVRFPTILKIDDQSVVSNFQELIRADYPRLQELRNQAVRIEMGVGDAPKAISTTTIIWQFSDAPNVWRVSLAREALTIESESYTSRQDLLARLEIVLKAMAEVFRPSLVERIGVRYVDRIVGPQFETFETLLDTRFLGSSFVKLKSHLQYSLNEAMFTIEEGELLLRWGVMPTNMTPDPGAISPLPNPSFVLDIDVSSKSQREFVIDALVPSFRSLAERAYSVFRFAVTEEFLKIYGAKT